MTPSPSVSPISSSTETSTAELKAELEYLRKRNMELQAELLDKTRNRRDSGTISDVEVEDKGDMASSSSLDSGLELAERTEAGGREPRELVRSNSISLDGNLPSGNGLHHRRTGAGKENNGEDAKQTRSFSFSNPFKRRGCVAKSKLSDVDLVHTTKNGGDLDSPASPRSKEEAGFDNECNNNHIPSPRSKEMKKASDGGGHYYYEPPLPIAHGDEEEGPIPDVRVETSLDSDGVEESDGLIYDDSSHHKHHPKILPTSPCSVASSSPSFPPFKDQVKERAGWLIGLMFLQSCSSFIIQYNQTFLQSHMVIVQFLTMLVGAGGNAGNQASVRVIRSLAIGTLNRHTMNQFLRQEAKMALCLSALIGTTGFIRAALFRTPLGETIAVTASVFAIVAISVAIGSTLPLGMKKVGIDPANSSTSIQVIMDILGVLITVCVSSFVLSFKIFQSEDAGGG